VRLLERPSWLTALPSKTRPPAGPSSFSRRLSPRTAHASPRPYLPHQHRHTFSAGGGRSSSASSAMPCVLPSAMPASRARVLKKGALYLQQQPQIRHFAFLSDEVGTRLPQHQAPCSARQGRAWPRPPVRPQSQAPASAAPLRPGRGRTRARAAGRPSAAALSARTSTLCPRPALALRDGQPITESARTCARAAHA